MATLTPRQRPSFRNLSHTTSSGFSTPAMARKTGGGDDLEVGDTVDVPGGMDGTVKFVGEVKGKPGFFVGVELSKRWAARGKNDGDAEGTRYFTVSTPGSGIFLPWGRATKRSSPATSIGSIPATPTTPSADNVSIQEQDEKTPPTPSLPPKFSQSVSGRASPAFRPKSRPSLPRPESPLRRPQVHPGAPPSATPAGRPSLSNLNNNKLAGPRYAASPTPAKAVNRSPAKAPNFSASVRGVPGHGARSPSRIGQDDGGDEVSQLKAIIQEKNEKIATITAEFDNHRTDFRNTLDTLELASTETERVYEQRVEDLLEERRLLMAQGEDVQSVAQQLRQLEEVVQELEEGLEDARRGEAEARGEVEFLRGEVERVRAELRREREKNAAMTNGAQYTAPLSKAPSHNSPIASPDASGTAASPSAPAPAPLATSNNTPAAVTEDPEKWCALCEQDGHDSISCPYDN